LKIQQFIYRIKHFFHFFILPLSQLQIKDHYYRLNMLKKKKNVKRQDSHLFNIDLMICKTAIYCNNLLEKLDSFSALLKITNFVRRQCNLSVEKYAYYLGQNRKMTFVVSKQINIIRMLK